MRKRFLMLSITMLVTTLLMIPGCGGEKGSVGGGGEMTLFPCCRITPLVSSP